jgi:pimeloyl-ACP methyl ester carboxylesterase
MGEQRNHRYAEVNGVRLHYVRQGAGTPVLLVHGWPGFWYEWRLNIDPLAERFDVVVPDMRGAGLSDKPDVPPQEGYTPAVMAADLLALVDHLGLGQVDVVAHDFGAVWVQQFARAYPERLHRLVLFDPPYPGIGGRWFQMPQVLESWYQFFHQQPWADELVASSRRATEIYVRHFLSHWSYDKNLWTDEEVREYVEVFSRPGAVRGGFNWYRAVFRGGTGAGGPVQAPTLVLWAENDPILPLAWADNLGEHFPNHTLVRVPECGHFMQRERPDLVNRHVTDFLGRS